jgi:Protein of unknown function (DUF2523).
MAIQAVALVAPLLGIGRALVALFASFKAWFAFWFITHIGDLALTALYSVGAGYATYELGSFALDTIYSQLTANTTGMPEMLLAALKTAGVFDALSVLFGGLAGAMALRGFLNQIKRSRMTFGKPEDWVT